jgi:DNA polymerase III epsilon subunit-like protein
MKVLIFDTETTGLPKTKVINPDSLHLWPHIVQLSYLVYDSDNNDIVVMEDNIIKTASGVVISQESSAIHGITSDISQTRGVNLDNVLNGFFGALKNVDVLVGHNISFDINVIVVELLRMIYNPNTGVSAEELNSYKINLHLLNNYKNVYCTMQKTIDFCAIKSISKTGREYNKFPKLIELHSKIFDTTPNNLHNSLNDILVTLRCYAMLTLNHDVYKTCDKFKLISKEINLLS